MQLLCLLDLLSMVHCAFASCLTMLSVLYQFAQELKICASIINMFNLIPAASSKLIEPLVTLVLKAEKALLMEVSSER